MSYPASYQEEAANALITRDLVVNGTITSTGGIVVTPADLGGVAHVRYVRPAGNNANDGLTPATAWATLVYAVTQLLTYAKNGAQVIDITGVNEVLPASFTLPQVICQSSVVVWAPGLFGVAYGITLHADLSTFFTVAPADIMSITPDVTTGQETVATALVLVPNALKGKIISQSGTPVGVVKSNDATDIITTVSGLNALLPVVLSEPGAILTTDGTPFTPTLSITQALCSILIEGIDLAAPQPANAFSVSAASDVVLLIACNIGGLFSLDTPQNLSVFESYFLPGTGGATGCDCTAPSLFFGCFFDAMTFNNFRNFAVSEGVFMGTCGFNGCGPLLVGTDISLVGQATFVSCDVLNSVSNAFRITGEGVFTISSCAINGCASDCILVDGQINLHLSTLPPGVGNLGFGVSITNGVHVVADNTVDITGLSGDTSIGNAGAFTWAAIAAMPFNRITDFGISGDGSTINRAP